VSVQSTSRIVNLLPLPYRTHIKQISAPPLPLWERAGVRGTYA
jgi:hypothetical protein